MHCLYTYNICQLPTTIMLIVLASLQIRPLLLMVNGVRGVPGEKRGLACPLHSSHAYYSSNMALLCHVQFPVLQNCRREGR